MLGALKSDRSLQAALVLIVALGAVYLFEALVLVGVDYRAASEQQRLGQAAVRHEAVCQQLGKSLNAPDYPRCMELLEELRGWHERGASEQNGGLL
jgi:hypothetical protein